MVYITKRNHELAFGVMFGKILKRNLRLYLDFNKVVDKKYLGDKLKIVLNIGIF